MTRALLAAMLAVALGGCEEVSPAEHFVDFGAERQTLARCTSGRPDLEAARRRFDSATPGIKATGASGTRVRAAIAANGGVLIAYAGRRYHSRYLSAMTHNWREAEEPVGAEAIVPSLDPHVVFVQAPFWKRRGRIDGAFMAWSSAHDEDSVCR